MSNMFTVPEDLVAVVRCKDCRHKAIGENYCLHPRREGGGVIRVKDNDFCSYGERRIAHGKE